jgi:hypothetical protein
VALPSDDSGFDAHLLKPVDEAALGKLFADLAGKQEALESAREVGSARLH